MRGLDEIHSLTALPKRKYSVLIAFAIVQEIELAPMQAGRVQIFLLKRVSIICIKYTLYVEVVCVSET